jgi:hypothetical protein
MTLPEIRDRVMIRVTVTGKNPERNRMPGRLFNLDRVAKSPIRDFLLHGKGKASFSLSLQDDVYVAEVHAGLLLYGKRKAGFSLPSRIEHVASGPRSGHLSQVRLLGAVSH